MKKLLSIILSAFLVLTVAAPVQAMEASEATAGVTVVNDAGYTISFTAYYDQAFEMLGILNDERAKAGLAPLQMDEELMECANLRAAESTIYFQHTRPNGTRCFTACDRLDGENIAYGYRTPAVVMSGWMNSPGHRSNILKDDFNSIGIGVIKYDGRMYWAQSFSYSDVRTPAVQRPNEDRSYTIDVDPVFCASVGVDLSKFSYTGRDIDDEDKEYKTGTIFRMYDSRTGEHLYTSDIAERDGTFESGWDYEGVAWISPATSSMPVYRLFNASLNDHHYTTDANERDELVSKHGWIYEKICWYSDDEKGVPLYRLFSPVLKVGAHHYTKSKKERDTLVAQGWIYEGIGWYGVKQ